MSNTLFSIFPNEYYIDLTLYQYGYEQCESLHSYGPYIRNHYLFHYIISGKGTVVSMNENGQNYIYELHSQQGFLICPGQINTYYADANEPWEYTWLEFDGIKAKEFLQIAGLGINAPIYTAKSYELAETVQKEMLYISEHSSSSSLHLIGHLFLFMDALVASSSSKIALKGGNLREFYLREAMGFIEQHYSQDITIQDIANACNLDRSYFGKIFKDSVGTSPQNFLISYRMSKATELLKTTKKSIKEISTEVGYENQLHFSRAFKKQYQISPRDWRLKARNNM